MESILAYGFMVRALVAGIFIAVACAILGVFLLLRRDAMIGHGLAHVTFGGIALGLILHIIPLAVALTVAILCSLGILELKEKAGIYGDTAIGIFSSIGMAIGIILATLAGSFNVDLLSYLFGNILAIEVIEVWISVILAGVIIIAVALFYQELFYLTFDPESARASGIHAKRLDRLLAVLTAVTIVLGMKIVGVLLVSALIVIPSAAGLQLATNFKHAIVTSSIVATGSVIAGLTMAFYWDLPASGAIVILSFLCFLLLFSLRLMRRPI